jgi:hypothetical protein
MQQTRAMKGGEYGQNGEFYAGGTFLPNTQLAKTVKRGKAQRIGKRQILPFVWEMQPSPNHYPLMDRVAEVIDWDHYRRTKKLICLAGRERFIERFGIANDLAAFLAGQRWKVRQ